MNQKFLSWAALGFSLVALVLVLVGGNNQSVELGGGTRFPNGISADSTSPVAGEVRGTDLTVTDDAVISGGSLTLTTSNTATSTAIIGCQQMYATSTATAVRFLFHSTTTPSAISGTAAGFVAWGYGSCPF